MHSITRPLPSCLGTRPQRRELEAAKEAWETAQQAAQEKSLAAGKQRAALEERQRQLLRNMTEYVEAPALDAAQQQLTACQLEVEQELAQLHGALLDLEAQLTPPGGAGAGDRKTGGDIGRSDPAAGTAAGGPDPGRGGTERPGRPAGAVGGDAAPGPWRPIWTPVRWKKLLPLSPRRWQRPGMSSPSWPSRSRSSRGKCSGSRSWTGQIPLEEQALRALEESAAKLREELAGTQSRKEEMAGQIQTLRDRLSFPDLDDAQQKIDALRAEQQGLARALLEARRPLPPVRGS